MIKIQIINFDTVSLIQQCSPWAHPTCSKNALKSEVFLLQHDQYFIPSWNIGTPGWWWQVKFSFPTPS